MQGEVSTSKNALLADVCIATFANPTFLPAYYFETKFEDGKTRSFNLIDGGVVAVNPVISLYSTAISVDLYHQIEITQTNSYPRKLILRLRLP